MGDIPTLIRGTVDVISLDDFRQKLARGKPLNVKLGVDPSTADLHLGHVVILRKLKQFQDAGHHILFIIGDATGRVGDPSGRSATRNLLTEPEVMANAKTYQEQVFKILDPKKTQVTFNSQWFKTLSFDEVITLTSRYTVARMMERDDFSQRSKSGVPISIVEFLYPLMQGYDSVMLKADVELGGTDQTFNLLVGRNLQKDYGQEPQVVMTLPLLLGTDGVKKMSKSFGNAIPISTTPEDMYGLIMSIPDKLMISYFELLTDLPGAEIKRLCHGVHPKDAKMQLAREIVTMFHGNDGAAVGQSHFERVFSRRQMPEAIEKKEVPKEFLVNEHVPLIKLLVLAGLAPSHAAAKRLIDQGGVELDGEKIINPLLLVDFSSRGEKVVKVGKRRFMKFVLPSD